MTFGVTGVARRKAAIADAVRNGDQLEPDRRLTRKKPQWCDMYSIARMSDHWVDLL
jgi:hypothetical protein